MGRGRYSALAETRLRIAYAGILGVAGERIALLDRDFVIRVALVSCCFALGVRCLLLRRVARVRSNTVDLGIRLGLDMRCLGFLYTDILGVAR